MASEKSGISDYWRGRIQQVLDSVHQEPRNMVEVVTEEPPEATEVNAAV